MENKNWTFLDNLSHAVTYVSHTLYMCNYNAVKLYVPVQETLSSSILYPARQTHWKDPFEFLHSCLHGL